MLGCLLGDAAVGDTGISGGSIALGTWTHVVVTYNLLSGDNRLYVQSQEVAQRTFLGGYALDDFMGGLVTFGAIPLDEVHLFGRDLTPPDIEELFVADNLGVCKCLDRDRDGTACESLPGAP